MRTRGSFGRSKIECWAVYSMFNLHWTFAVGTVAAAPPSDGATHALAASAPSPTVVANAGVPKAVV